MLHFHKHFIKQIDSNAIISYYTPTESMEHTNFRPWQRPQQPLKQSPDAVRVPKRRLKTITKVDTSPDHAEVSHPSAKYFHYPVYADAVGPQGEPFTCSAMNDLLTTSKETAPCLLRDEFKTEHKHWTGVGLPQGFQLAIYQRMPRERQKDDRYFTFVLILRFNTILRPSCTNAG